MGNSMRHAEPLKKCFQCNSPDQLFPSGRCFECQKRYNSLQSYWRKLNRTHKLKEGRPKLYPS